METHGPLIRMMIRAGATESLQVSSALTAHFLIYRRVPAAWKAWGKLSRPAPKAALTTRKTETYHEVPVSTGGVEAPMGMVIVDEAYPEETSGETCTTPYLQKWWWGIPEAITYTR